MTQRNTIDPLAVSIPEAARLLGIGRTLAYDLARQGDLPTFELGGRKLVPVDGLRRLIEDLSGERAAS
jgi:excisionase family DNA binding protein